MIRKQNTTYRCAIHVGIKVGVLALQTCAQNYYLQCSELFAMGKSSLNMVLHKFVVVVNVVFRNQIQWPWNEDLSRVMAVFKDWCGLLFVHGAIDCTQIHNHKPKGVFLQISFLTNLEFTTCSCKWLLITRSGFKMFLWDCQDFWMIIKFLII